MSNMEDRRGKDYRETNNHIRALEKLDDWIDSLDVYNREFLALLMPNNKEQIRLNTDVFRCFDVVKFGVSPINQSISIMLYDLNSKKSKIDRVIRKEELDQPEMNKVEKRKKVEEDKKNSRIRWYNESVISAPTNPKSRSPKHVSIFQELAKIGKAPNISSLASSTPIVVAHQVATISYSLVRGILFEDALRNIRCFKSYEIPIADNQFLRAMLSVFMYDQDGLALYNLLTDELKNRDVELPHIPFQDFES
ncbi:hypothetical protein L6452_01790 [Arctium lappa]|uniref:Uncharacterized protein n=1 Tax=Arctium lappa TaxID=4217 RepID=A0ACB9FH36_ARCLA|nr:hypothetical protein L6452_01790 [Arctium lappa]